MNNHNLVIYEFDELYKILVEIKKDINLSFEKATRQKLPDLNSKTNCLVFTKKEIPGLNNQIVFNDFPIPIFKLLEKINIEFIKKKFHEQSEITIGNYNFNDRINFFKIEYKSKIRGKSYFNPITLKSIYPFGVMRTKVIFNPKSEIIVYPKKVLPSDELLKESKIINIINADEFDGIDEFKNGDSFSKIAWKIGQK